MVRLRPAAVSDGVLFEPWLTSVATGTVPLDGLIVRAAGPQAASPGQSVVFGATYLNETGQEIRDAVLVLLLPNGAAFEEAYPTSTGEGRGIYWSERHQVFWRLGTLPPGAAGTVAARVRFYWGLPAHTDSPMVLMAGSNQGATGFDLPMAGSNQGAMFDLPSYLAHVPVDILSTTSLTPAEVDAERQPLEPATTYTVRATQGIKDLVGNPLAADFVWTFRTAGGGNVYLPLVLRTS